MKKTKTTDENELDRVVRQYFQNYRGEEGKGVLRDFPKDVQRIIWRKVIDEEKWSAEKAEEMARGGPNATDIREIKLLKERCDDLDEKIRTGGRKKTTEERRQDDLTVTVLQQNIVTITEDMERHPNKRLYLEGVLQDVMTSLQKAYQERATDTRILYASDIVHLLRESALCKERLKTLREFKTHPTVLRQTTAGLSDLSWVLAHDDQLWERWWYEDFTRFDHDLQINANGLPEWIIHQVDRSDGPWRRFYAWCKFFEHKFSKYVVRICKKTCGEYLARIPEIQAPGCLDREVLAPDDITLLSNYTVKLEYSLLGTRAFTIESLASIALDLGGSEELEELVTQSGSPWLAWLSLKSTHNLRNGFDLAIPLYEFSVVGKNNHIYNYATDGREEARILARFLRWYAHTATQQLTEEERETLDVHFIGEDFYQTPERTFYDFQPLEDIPDPEDPWKMLRELPSLPRRDGIRFAGTCISCDAPQLFECSGCKEVRYCSVECQKADWQSGHKNECK